ncbi:ABC-type multidrug transport system fused ATPase/permease subunit [Algoriphagus iocasae]|uniref:ABC-type multidrug transport system fused ATPase/permease subunit n=1 Tax=Algoriphagus iocasae TaxID=1836499 RepID=A0A841MWW5_9BACT|nr:hypothetical protein [Algoriphagus iocasae]MBB6326965.1 ABC-type multidrug transport system fused ATPase/permease subunit [Algoriphagus iocasae]
MNLEPRKRKLQTRITLFTWIGGISAVAALIPLIWAGFQVFQSHSFFRENELGDFIGGTSGTFASFAALAFVYVGFLGQQLQILMQQEELEMNRQELKDTRVEIKGQKEQLELQNKFNSETQIKNTFFKLLDTYTLTKSQVSYHNLIDYHRELAHFEAETRKYPASDISKYKPKIKSIKEDIAFENILYYLEEWSINHWK